MLKLIHEYENNKQPYGLFIQNKYSEKSKKEGYSIILLNIMKDSKKGGVSNGEI